MVKAKINLIEARKTIKKLSLKDRAKLVEELEAQTWKERFRQMYARIDAKVKKNPISQKEIIKICKEARRKLYGKT